MKLGLAGITTLVMVAGNAHAALDMASAEAMMKKDGCAACHAVDKKIRGRRIRKCRPNTKATRTLPRSLRKK